MVVIVFVNDPTPARPASPPRSSRPSFIPNNPEQTPLDDRAALALAEAAQANQSSPNDVPSLSFIDRAALLVQAAPVLPRVLAEHSLTVLATAMVSPGVGSEVSYALPTSPVGKGKRVTEPEEGTLPETDTKESDIISNPAETPPEAFLPPQGATLLTGGLPLAFGILEQAIDRLIPSDSDSPDPRTWLVHGLGISTWALAAMLLYLAVRQERERAGKLLARAGQWSDLGIQAEDLP